MLGVFTKLADLIVYDLFDMASDSNLASGFHFFIEDTTKIYSLLILMIYVIGFLRASIDVEFVRNYLSGKNRVLGYLLASLFGVVTPFCSCSSIPLFLGFTQARIPIGITMAFLITSPMINEVALLLLGSILGVKFMILYCLLGVLSGVIGGVFFDVIKADKYLLDFVKKAKDKAQVVNDPAKRAKMGFGARHEFAKEELLSIFGRVWKWVLIGVGAGAFLHGFVPEEFIAEYFGSEAWWNVPAIVLLGIPLYSSVHGVIPVAESLINKGLPIGTAVAFMMSMSAASFPEFMMLKQVMKGKLLVIFFVLLLVLFTICGWILNVSL